MIKINTDNILILSIIIINLIKIIKSWETKLMVKLKINLLRDPEKGHPPNELRN